MDFISRKFSKTMQSNKIKRLMFQFLRKQSLRDKRGNQVLCGQLLLQKHGGMMRFINIFYGIIISFKYQYGVESALRFQIFRTF